MHVPAITQRPLTVQPVQVGKEYASKAKAAKTPAQAGVCSDEGTKAVHQVLTVHGKGALWELRHLARQMRQVPQIDLFVPTVSPSTLRYTPQMPLLAYLSRFCSRTMQRTICMVSRRLTHVEGTSPIPCTFL